MRVDVCVWAHRIRYVFNFCYYINNRTSLSLSTLPVSPSCWIWSGGVHTNSTMTDLSVRHGALRLAAFSVTWREGCGGGTVGGVSVLRTQRCHLRAGFRQCKSFVEMGTVRCCPLGRTVPCGLCPGCWCGGLHHQSTQTLAGCAR